MMMNRRFVNLVLENYTTNMYALHRLDVSKHLFYPSTAEAEEAHAKNDKETNNGGGGGKPKPLRIERLRRLPPPITGFVSSASPTRDPKRWHPMSEDMFVLLHGGRRGGGGEPGCKILHANSAGHAVLYDADSRAVVCVPDLGEPKGDSPMSFVVPGAGAGEEESLYVLRSVLMEPTYYQTDLHRSHNFKVLHFGGGGDSDDDDDDLRSYGFDLTSNFKWHPLPPPPLSGKNLVSSTVVDGGRTICVSAMSNGTGTFCFDTGTQQWRHAGDWKLPFYGRSGEYLPELETWVGFSTLHPHHLCSADLTGIAMASSSREGPTIQHVWEDFTPPATVETELVLNRRFPGIVRQTRLEWTSEQLHLVRLGSGRLCIVKVFNAEETVSLSCSFDEHQEHKGKLTLLVGVELLHGSDGELRMIKHKTKRFVFPSNRIKCVL
ncbi:hypothetical protein HU200_028227 [Digitaria exilis]|uniref:Uncharacterized protein n=1 Tax=Digitaria exilis TaxID=1010633 RepID=A0A835BSB4_9POAL|nr:hypothetical protein HU200_028223 [Digitaria exilis]KAF8713450.1 hypothetical protein HU200_028225 [Digitaria exilis]KAF8713452.1 hypothetical protein HU200_028227 [Digitaria exilis]